MGERLPRETCTAVAMIYLNQAAEEVVSPNGKYVTENVTLDEIKKVEQSRMEARAEWLRQRSADGLGGVGEPGLARMFYIGPGYVPLTVAVFCNEATDLAADTECYEIVREWLQEHRPEELDDDGLLDEDAHIYKIPPVPDDPD